MGDPSLIDMGRDPNNPFSTPPSDDSDDKTVFKPSTPTPSPTPRPTRTPQPARTPEPRTDYTAPTPRGAPPGAPPPMPRSPSRPVPPSPTWEAAPAEFNWQTSASVPSDNPVLDAARLIFAVVGRLRLSTSAPAVDRFYAQMVQQVKEFDRALGVARVPQDIAVPARYALCSFVDETVMATPWGSSSGWGQRTLLNVFHNEGWGGEKFFSIAERAVSDPARFLPLLEFLFVCLGFGFQGRYRVLPQGMAALAEVQESIYRAIRTQRGDGERDLSTRWQGERDKRNPLIRYVPLWVVGAVCAAVLACAFLGFRVMLGGHADPTELAISGIGRDAFTAATTAPPVVVPAGVKRLKAFLEDEIAEGLVTVEETPDRAAVRLASDQCFASGSATVSAPCRPTLERVAKELNQVGGRVEVVGHSDNVPLKSLRFASNLALSRARADGVLTALQGFGVDAARLSADGRADAEPIGDNATAAGRGQNRRVEIIVFEGAAAVAAPGGY